MALLAERRRGPVYTITKNRDPSGRRLWRGRVWNRDGVEVASIEQGGARAEMRRLLEAEIAKLWGAP